MAVAAAGSLPAVRVDSAEWIQCRLHYDLEGWSFIDEQARGTGRIACSNRAAAQVRIVAHGGGGSFRIAPR